MGCTSSVPIREEQRIPKRGVGDSPSREGASSHGIGMETTASDHNSVRRAVTVWDLQIEKERKARERRRSSVRTPTARFASDSDRFSVSDSYKKGSSSRDNLSYPQGYSHQSRSSREYGGVPSRGATPRSQAMIPSWTTSQPVLTRCNSLTRTNSLSRSSSFVLNSPSGRTRGSPIEDCNSDIGGGTPRHSTGSHSIPNFSHVRTGNSYPITSENASYAQPLRYGSRRTADYYPSRSTRW